MRKTNTLLIIVVVNVLFAVTAMAQRTVQNLNHGWRFHAGSIDNAASLSLDDSSWRIVNLPHDFQIEQPWVAPAADEKADNNDPAANIKSRLSSRGFKEMGIGWYRLHLNLADSLKGRRLLIDFGGIMYVGDVYMNGQRVGGTDYGYVGFQVDVTNAIRWGEDNVLAVMADTRQPENSRWYTGGGLFRMVRLISTNATIVSLLLLPRSILVGATRPCLYRFASPTPRASRSMRDVLR